MLKNSSPSGSMGSSIAGAGASGLGRREIGWGVPFPSPLQGRPALVHLQRYQSLIRKGR